jgi:hypothetical protein
LDMYVIALLSADGEYLVMQNFSILICQTRETSDVDMPHWVLIVYALA